MNLKNYTSLVPPEKSVMQIEKRLVGIGATHIAKSYDDGELSGIMFQINQNGRPISLKRVREQAQRTAWKLLFDWIEVQASMILIGHREATEVFLPYMYDFKNDETLYQKLSASNFKMLGAGEKN